MLIDHNMTMAAEFAKLIEEHSEFELITAPQTNILTYRYVPSSWKGLGSKTESQPICPNTVFAKATTRVGVSFVSRTSFVILN